MAISHAASGVPLNLLPHGEVLSEATTTALVKLDEFEAIRLVVPKNHEVCGNHQVKGPLTIQCLKGQIAITVDGETHSVSEGHWLFLPGGVPHTISGVEESIVLLTIIFR